jgi:hypothetical protein
VPADHAPHQSFMAKVVEAALFAIALAGGVDQREIARLAVRLGVLFALRKIERFQRNRNFFGEADTYEPSGGDRVTVANETDRLLGSDNLSALRSPQWHFGGSRHGLFSEPPLARQ